MSARTGGGAVTVRDVAARAGVSPMTVSRTLAGGKNVREELQERVHRAVAELGYRRNENARSIRPGQPSGLVGVAITNLGNPYYGEFAVGVEEVAEAAGRRILLGNSGEDQSRERQLLADFIGRQVDGLIVVPAAGGSAHHLLSSSIGATRLVLASRLVEGVNADAVLLDDEGGARRGTEMLIAAGHRRIGYLGNVSSLFTGQRRFAGFSRALAAAGIPLIPELISREQQDVASAGAAMHRLLALQEPPTAVFAANNRNAIGAMTAIGERIRAHGGSGPALVSFDSFELAELTPVPLTLVEHDARELGRRAARLLLDGRSPGASRQVDTLPVSIRVIQADPGPH